MGEPSMKDHAGYDPFATEMKKWHPMFSMKLGPSSRVSEVRNTLTGCLVRNGTASLSGVTSSLVFILGEHWDPDEREFVSVDVGWAAMRAEKLEKIAELQSQLDELRLKYGEVEDGN